MLAEVIEKLSEDLEREELEAANGAAPAVYRQLLAIYLYKNDLCNAKYLWKRIPPSIKANNKELAQVWAVAEHMWKRDLPGTYKALGSCVWSENIAEIMKCVQENVKARAVNLIAQAYSSITLDKVAAMTGCSYDEAGKSSLDRGWNVEADIHMVHPVRPPAGSGTHISSEDQLQKLTDFVSYLEN